MTGDPPPPEAASAAAPQNPPKTVPPGEHQHPPEATPPGKPQDPAMPAGPKAHIPDTEPARAPHPTLRRRPGSLDPAELGFTPRKPVPWLAPLLLISTGLRTLLAILFGAYLDKRELQNALPSHVHVQPGTDGELWLDYVADLGDGFNATYSVAYLLAQPDLPFDGRRLPRGEALIMGGDQVYPTPSTEAYEDRCKGPYIAAMPCPPRGAPRPTLYALPGNHDWYDGLTAFLRLFVRVKTDNIGGWRTEQSRSYFAIQLPANWWLFGIDEQFNSYLDDPQLLYFERAARKLAEGDNVILVVPAPTWVKAVDRPPAYDTIDYFIRSVLAPVGANVRLIIAGDLHHYARYAGPDRELVTCGGGGAYLASTHGLPEKITVPAQDAIARKRSPSREYELRDRYPDAGRSRRYAAGVFGRLPLRNPGFVTLLGTLHALLMLAVAGLLHGRISGTEQRLFSIPILIMVTVTMLSAFFFARPPVASSKRNARHVLLGVAHGLAHVGLGILGAWLWVRLPFVDWPWPMPAVAGAVVYGPVAGLVASQLVALYLLIAGAFRVNLNELFAGQGIEDGKCFLRLHVARDGTLTVYPIAVDRISRQWRPTPDAAPDAPWLEPMDPLEIRPAGPPIVIPRTMSGAAAPPPPTPRPRTKSGAAQRR